MDIEEADQGFWPGYFFAINLLIGSGGFSVS